MGVSYLSQTSRTFAIDRGYNTSVPSSTSTVLPDPPGSSAHVFHSDESILEAMNAPDYPWDDMHHRSYFLPQDAFTPKGPSDQYSVESKDLIPPGHLMVQSKIYLYSTTPNSKNPSPNSKDKLIYNSVYRRCVLGIP